MAAIWETKKQFKVDGRQCELSVFSGVILETERHDAAYTYGVGPDIGIRNVTTRDIRLATPDGKQQAFSFDSPMSVCKNDKIHVVRLSGPIFIRRQNAKYFCVYNETTNTSHALISIPELRPYATAKLFFVGWPFVFAAGTGLIFVFLTFYQQSKAKRWMNNIKREYDALIGEL